MNGGFARHHHPMDSSIAIRVDRVAKTYRIWDSPLARLSTPILEAGARLCPPSSGLAGRLHDRASSHYRDFSALQDISFELPRGRSLGVIGRNGSGKSTLLQIVTGTLQPTSGTVEVNGRIAALLELGSGFNPDFTGRENVYLNGAVHGFTRSQMDEKFDSIAAFADIGDFIDEPTKTYSSGMAVRLAFAVAICSLPDILIVDEALSVGDVFFQQKCFRRIREILDQGTTLLFVSHDTAAVQNLCHEGILLDRGRMAYRGSPEECTSRYFSLEADKAAPAATPAGERIPESSLDKTHADILAANIIGQARARHGLRAMEFTAIAFFNDRNLSIPNIEMGQTGRIYAVLRALTDVPEYAVGVRLHDRMSNLVFATGNKQLRIALPSLRAGDELMVRFDLGFTVNPGVFTLTLDCSEPSAQGPNFGVFHDVVEGLGPVTVHYETAEVWPFYGIAQLPLQLHYSLAVGTTPDGPNHRRTLAEP